MNAFPFSPPRASPARVPAHNNGEDIALGLDDRDYMRQRNRRNLDRLLQDMDRQRPFTPASEQPSVLVMIGWWVGAAFLLYKAYGWWTEHQRPPAQPAVYGRPQGDPAPSVQSRPPEQAVAAQPVPQVAYVPPPPAPVMEAPRPRTGGTIYLCRDYSGGSFWASDHCNRHNALIDRMVSVPEGMPFEQQVQLAEQRRQALSGATSSAQTTAVNAPAPAVVNKSLCQSLDARVNELDAMARQPQTGGTQDWIRMERQKTRDAQFRLRC